MEALVPFFKEFGLAGLVVLGCAYILRVIIMWLLARIEVKDSMIDTRHTELVDLTRSVITYVNESKDSISEGNKINKELVLEVKSMGGEIKGLGTSICSKIDGITSIEKKDEKE